MSHHVSYPEKFPTECLSELIAIARSGLDQLTVRKAEVGIHSWNILGFGQSILLGNPDGPFHAMAPEDQSATQQQLEEFATELAACCPKDITQADLAAVKAPANFGAAGSIWEIDWDKWFRFFKEKVLPILNAL